MTGHLKEETVRGRHAASYEHGFNSFAGSSLLKRTLHPRHPYRDTEIPAGVISTLLR